MSVEIAKWRTRCGTCNEVYGDEYDSPETARERDQEACGECAECAQAWLPTP